jgi:hypothetical protein
VLNNIFLPADHTTGNTFVLLLIGADGGSLDIEDHRILCGEEGHGFPHC